MSFDQNRPYFYDSTPLPLERSTAVRPPDDAETLSEVVLRVAGSVHVGDREGA